MKEITDKSIEELDETMLDNLVTWQYNGSKSTIDEFRKLDTEGKMGVIDFIKEFKRVKRVILTSQFSYRDDERK